jgi:hypothetical protein
MGNLLSIVQGSSQLSRSTIHFPSRSFKTLFSLESASKTPVIPSIMTSAQIDPSHIVSGPFQDVQVPDTDIYSFMFEREQVGNFPPTKNPDRIAFIDGPTGKKITFRDLKERVKVLSRGLSKGMNIKTGDVVCFFMPNHVEPEIYVVLI